MESNSIVTPAESNKEDINEVANDLKSKWKVGAIVEARDLQDNWYKSRIIEIDEANKRAKVHFFGWNSRYDQWFDLNSKDIKEYEPVVNKPNISEKSVTKPVETSEILDYDSITERFEVGSKVLAKWIDNFYYMAIVQRQLRRNKTLYYEVKFEDGIKRHARYDFVKQYDEKSENQVAKLSTAVTATKNIPAMNKEIKPTNEPIVTNSESQIVETTGRSTRPKRMRTISTNNPDDPFIREFPVKKRKISERKSSISVEPVNMNKTQDLNLSVDQSKIKILKNSMSAIETPTPPPPIPSLKLKIKTDSFTTTTPSVLLSQSISYTPMTEQQELIKCKFVNCDKTFRKQSLLDYHIKYHHYEDGRIIEIKSKKRKLTLQSDDTLNSSLKSLDKQPSTETVDEIEPYEAIHCECGKQISNGFMIQCDICLCWQHGDCVNVNEENAPSNYLCWICKNASVNREAYFKNSKLWSKMLIKKNDIDKSNIIEMLNECCKHHTLLKQLTFSIDYKISIVKNKKDLSESESETLLQNCEDLQNRLEEQLKCLNTKISDLDEKYGLNVTNEFKIAL